MAEALHLKARCIDIAGDDALQERYGARIPVLRRGDGAELGWPFDVADLQDFAKPPHLLEANPSK